MKKEKLSIPNISCGHCVMSIKNELSELDGVTSVEGDPAQKTITIEWDVPGSLDQIKATLKEINYPAEQIRQPLNQTEAIWFSNDVKLFTAGHS